MERAEFAADAADSHAAHTFETHRERHVLDD